MEKNLEAQAVKTKVANRITGRWEASHSKENSQSSENASDRTGENIYKLCNWHPEFIGAQEIQLKQTRQSS